jgi:Amino acid synthesis
MGIKIRCSFVIVGERWRRPGVWPTTRCAARPLLLWWKILRGPLVEDLTTEDSVQVGREVGQVVLSAFGQIPVQSYGKGGIVGLAGEQEHAMPS